MDFFQAVSIGLVQGVTEWFPVSSKTHLVIAERLLGIDASGVALEVVLHLGTLASAVVGDIVRDHTMRLAYEGGRWGVVWDEGLILPELAGGNRLALELRIPSRGNIYDLNGKALAERFHLKRVSLINDFAAAANQAGLGSGVVRRTKRPDFH